MFANCITLSIKCWFRRYCSFVCAQISKASDKYIVLCKICVFSGSLCFGVFIIPRFFSNNHIVKITAFLFLFHIFCLLVCFFLFSLSLSLFSFFYFSVLLFSRSRMCRCCCCYVCVFFDYFSLVFVEVRVTFSGIPCGIRVQFSFFLVLIFIFLFIAALNRYIKSGMVVCNSRMKKSIRNV